MCPRKPKLFPLACTLAFCLGAVAGTPAVAEAVRTAIMASELVRAGMIPEEPVHNDQFMSQGTSAPALHAFSGALTLTAEAMHLRPALENRTVMGRDAQMFPGVTLSFFSHEGTLVPVTQEIIVPGEEDAANSFWNLLVQPGRVWSEPGDEGWSRASFPFALMNQLENDTHNGIATFLYNDSEVSEVRFQIVQQTAPYYIAEHFLAWGQLAADYAPDTDLGEETGLRAAYSAAEAHRLPAKTWDALEAKVGKDKVAGFEGAMNSDLLVTSALVHDGVLYYKPSRTAQGAYPYTLEMRFGIWSVTKSIGPGLGMLRLAEKYGPYVFDLKVTDYLDIQSEHDGWDEVTFGDLLNMASGLGGGTVTANPNDMYVDYLDASYDAWYTSSPAAEKLAEVAKVGKYPWGPGQVARYRDRDMFVLGAAMNAFLKSVQGPEADVWNLVRDEVFKPIHIDHAPMNRTVEPGGLLGLPIMAWGWYPSLDDLAKVAGLLHRRGIYNGEQILHREKTAALFSIEGTLPQGPGNSYKYGERRYKMGYHYVPYEDMYSGRVLYVPYMSGWIGNQVVMLPGDMTAIRISRAWPAPDEDQAAAGDPTPMIEVANRLRGFTN